jgi:hypothetical protein
MPFGPQHEPCENCGFNSTLVEVRGYRICSLCVNWLNWEPGRVLAVERKHGPRV